MTAANLVRIILALVLIISVAAPEASAIAVGFPGAELDENEPTSNTLSIAAPGEIRVGVVRTKTAEEVRDYQSGAPLNGFYDLRISYMESFLRSEGFSVGEVDDTALASLATLKNFDVLVFARTLAMTPQQRSAVRAYATEGGGIVGSFGMSRWDFNPEYPFGYLPFLGMAGAPGVYTWPPSSDALKTWEWGEVSEIYNTKFRNDPLMYGSYQLEPSSSHWILEHGFDASDSRRMVDRQDQYNEVVEMLPGGRNVTPLYRYDTTVNGNPSDDDETGYVASWAAEYYFGRLVYFGFQMHDLIRGGIYADADTVDVARKVLANSVRWAGSPHTYTHVHKTVDLSGSAWYTRETLYINQTVTNLGTTSLRGPLRVEVRNPSGVRVYMGQAYDKQCPVPPDGTYTHRSYSVPLRYPEPGIWTIRMTYLYFDYFRGGWVEANRTISIDSNGSAMWGSRVGAQTLAGDGNRPVAGSRVEGASRYETSVELSQVGWPEGVSASGAVVLVTGTGYSDALAAAPLAGQLDAPILLIPRGSMPAALAAELRRLYAGCRSGVLVVVGGELAVPSSVVSEARSILQAAGVTEMTVDRLDGNDRYGTARAIAERVGVRRSGPFAETAIIVSGQNYPDALAVGPLAAAHGVPVLPVRPNSIPDDIASALSTLGVRHSTIVGGTVAVSPAVQSSLEWRGHRLAGVADNSMEVDTRLAGMSRYETALLAGRYSVALGGFTTGHVYFATGRTWPDALALGPLAGKERRTLILVHGTEIGSSVSVANHLLAKRTAPPVTVFVGGPGAISDYVRGQVRIALGQ